MHAERGHCHKRRRVWYYDKRTGYCERFIYTGCGGNKNRFNNMKTCVKTCNAKENRNAENAEIEGLYDAVTLSLSISLSLPLSPSLFFLYIYLSLCLSLYI